MAIISFGNVQEQFETAVPVIYFINLVLFSAFLIYWKERVPYEII